MYKYYLFKIKNNYNNDSLYNLFDSIRRSSIKYISTSFSFYDSITDTINFKEIDRIIDFLSSNDNYQYINDTHKYADYYSNEVTSVKILNNYIYLSTNKRDSDVLKYLKQLDNYYLCNFDECYGESLRYFTL